MRSHITLGRIAGIAIGINLSVVVIAFLIAWTLAAGLLPSMAPGYEDPAYVTAGIIGAVGLLASIVAHELGHAVVAKRNGIHVEKVTLWALGGLAQLEGEVTDPHLELKVAGVGPLISMVIGVVSLIPSFFLDGISGVMFAWMGGINLLLAFFNLIPGSPLDGGRILHAFLWRRHGDRARATATASRTGRFVGVALVGLGGIQLLMGSLGGLWTIVIGWFLQGAALAEGRHGRLTSELEGLTVREVMAAQEAPVPDWLSVGAFIERLEVTPRRTAYLMAGFDGRLSGVLVLDDLVRVPASQRYGTSIRTVARAADDFRVVDAGDPASKLLTAIAGGPFVVVVDGETPLGLITASEVGQTARTTELLSRLRRD